MKHAIRKSLWAGMILAYSYSKGQTPIEPVRKYDGTVDYQKTKQPARIFEFRYGEKDLEDAMSAIVRKIGGESRYYKGLYQSRQLRLSPDENRYYDLYYKIEGLGKGASQTSTLSVVLAEPGEDILLRNPSSPEVARATLESKPARAFFDSLGAGVGAYDLDKRIAEQEEAVRKAEKRHADLDRKRQRLEADLAENRSDLDKAKLELERSRAVLSQTQSLKRQK